MKGGPGKGRDLAVALQHALPVTDLRLDEGRPREGPRYVDEAAHRTVGTASMKGGPGKGRDDVPGDVSALCDLVPR